MLIYFYVTEYKSIKKIYFRKFNKVFLCEKRKKLLLKLLSELTLKMFQSFPDLSLKRLSHSRVF